MKKMFKADGKPLLPDGWRLSGTHHQIRLLAMLEYATADRDTMGCPGRLSGSSKTPFGVPRW
jgi:hypothetical protein